MAFLFLRRPTAQYPPAAGVSLTGKNRKSYLIDYQFNGENQNSHSHSLLNTKYKIVYVITYADYQVVSLIFPPRG